MGAPSLDLSGFTTKVANGDLARSNLYTVVFSSLNTVENGGIDARILNPTMPLSLSSAILTSNFSMFVFSFIATPSNL